MPFCKMRGLYSTDKAWHLAVLQCCIFLQSGSTAVPLVPLALPCSEEILHPWVGRVSSHPFVIPEFAQFS